MGFQHRDAFPVIAGRHRFFQRTHAILHGLPLRDILGEDRIEVFSQRRQRHLGGLLRGSPEPDRDDAAALIVQAQFAGQRDVPIRGALIGGRDPPVLGDILPAIAETHVTGGHAGKSAGGHHGEHRLATFRVQHIMALVLVAPGRVPPAAIVQMRRQQGIQRKRAWPGRRRILVRLELHFVQQGVAPWVRENCLDGRVATFPAGVLNHEGGDAGFQHANLGVGMAFLLGEEPVRIARQQAEIADIRLIQPRIVDFVDNSVGKREPDPASPAHRHSYAFLCAGGPAGRDSRRAPSDFMVKVHI